MEGDLGRVFIGLLMLGGCGGGRGGEEKRISIESKIEVSLALLLLLGVIIIS